MRKVKNNQKKQIKKESEQATVLSLAPFAPNAKLFFEDITVGTEATRELIIQNPTSQDIQVSNLLEVKEIKLIANL